MAIRRALVAALTGLLVVTSVALGPAAGTELVDREDAAAADRSNIVVVLLDDMSANLLQYMNATSALAESSVVFDNFIMSNPLCCPSRATIQTGKFPHNSEVRSNWWPVGGFGQFLDNDLETSLGPFLDGAGYRTSLMGKFMNEYLPAGDGDGTGSPDYPSAFVPPGWDEWFVAGNGYGQFEYQMVAGRDGKSEIVEYDGVDETNYLTDVLADQAVDFISRAGADDNPFFLMVAPFAVHSARASDDPQAPDGYRFPAAPRDRADSPHRPAAWGQPEFENGNCGDPIDGGCADVDFPDPMNEGNFNVIPENPPRWAPSAPLPPEEVAELEAFHVQRVQMIQSVDDLVGRVMDALHGAGVSGKTYVVVTSDNGFHLGEHAIRAGKSTAYDHDVRVPLVIHLPGGTEPAVVPHLVQNTDLLPTFLEIAGVPVPDDVDGASLLKLIRGRDPARWRQGALIEYVKYAPSSGRLGPDRVTGDSPPTYHALRTQDYLYVDYSTLDDIAPKKRGAELYDLRSDPDMVVNTWQNLPPDLRKQLNAELGTVADCAGVQCKRRLRDVPSLD